MTIDDLKTSISEMSLEEGTSFLLEIRKRRRTPPIKKASKIKGKVKELDINLLLSNISSVDAKGLLEILEGS